MTEGSSTSFPQPGAVLCRQVVQNKPRPNKHKSEITGLSQHALISTCSSVEQTRWSAASALHALLCLREEKTKPNCSKRFWQVWKAQSAFQMGHFKCSTSENRKNEGHREPIFITAHCFQGSSSFQVALGSIWTLRMCVKEFGSVFFCTCRQGQNDFADEDRTGPLRAWA